MATRFQDPGSYLAEFADEALVICPHCARAALVTRAGTGGGRPRLACTHCGYVRDQAEASCLLGAPVDPYFHRPLWLQVPCCGEVLWAYNAAHLDFLYSYVRAGLRESPRAPSGPLPARRLRRPSSNSSLTSRLPTWMKRATNRDAVLHGIAKLRERIE